MPEDFNGDKITSSSIILDEFQVPKFYQNIVRLDRKISDWNRKVENSEWVAFLDFVLKIITFNRYHFKERMLAPRLHLKKIEPLNAIARDKVLSNLEGYLEAPSIGWLARREFQSEMEWKNSLAGKVSAVGRFIGSVAKHAARQAIRKAPEMIVKHAMKAVMIGVAVQFGANPADVALAIKMGEITDPSQIAPL